MPHLSNQIVDVVNNVIYGVGKLKKTKNAFMLYRIMNNKAIPIARFSSKQKALDFLEWLQRLVDPCNPNLIKTVAQTHQ